LVGAAEDCDGGAYTDFGVGEQAVQVIDPSDRLAAEGNDYVAFAEAGFVCGAAGFGGEDDDSGFFGEIVETHNAAVQGNGLRFDSDKRPADAALLEQAAGYELGGIDADGEAKALGSVDGGGVDADDFAIRGNQGAAGIAGIEGGVGLNDVVDHAAGVGAKGTSEGTDDSGGDGVLKTVGIADGDGYLADAKSLRIAEGDGSEIGSVVIKAIEADYGEVGGGIVADEVRGAMAAVGE